MSTRSNDERLGMNQAISRRDLLNGVAFGLVAGSVFGCDARRSNEPGSSGKPLATVPPSPLDYAPERAADYYPPARTGMRGSHDGSFAIAHRLRDGDPALQLDHAIDSGETYDLIVVGAGISGLSAAHFYQNFHHQAARILILDNHDDFGGHAMRNELVVDGRTLITYGGTQSIADPESFSEVAKGLLTDLGIKVERFGQYFDHSLFKDYGTAAFFDKETFGADRTVSGMNQRPWSKFLAQSPLNPRVRKDIARLYEERRDYLKGMSLDEKKSLLRRISYAQYLTQYCGALPESLPFFQTLPHDLFCVGIDAVSAYSCYTTGDDYGAFTYPGFDGLGFPARSAKEPYIYHFPDGCASVARLLVRKLVPGAVPGQTMEDVVTSRVDYGKLDRDRNLTRVRLNSTVLRVRHAKPNSPADGVQVVYHRGDKLFQARGRACILACYNSSIPKLCPELGERQKQALSYLVKMPLLYSHVAIRNYRSFDRLKAKQIVSPGSYHTFTALDFPVSLGDYQFAKSKDEPTVLFMLRTPCKPGLTRREQNRLGRWELMHTPYETIERNIREQLDRMLGPYGFVPARDIAAITVNRWAHGYAFAPNRLFDPAWPEGEAPWEIGRKPLGRIAIANSDAGGTPYMDCAIDEAHRAVLELG